jgi:hypothetical protein
VSPAMTTSWPIANFPLVWRVEYQLWREPLRSKITIQLRHANCLRPSWAVFLLTQLSVITTATSGVEPGTMSNAKHRFDLPQFLR